MSFQENNNFSHPLVSVVVPHFNRNDLIGHLIENVAQQHYRPIELLIVDDGSDVCPSLPESVLKQHQQQGLSIDICQIKHTGRPGLVRNAGIEKSRGKYIAFLDSDDLWFPEKLVKQVDLLETRPDIGLVHGDAMIAGEGVEERYLGGSYYGQEMGYSDLLKSNFVLTSSVISRAEILKDNPFLDLPSAQDYELWLRLIKSNSFSFMPETIFLYSHHRKDSVSRKGGRRYLCLLNIFGKELGMAQKSEHITIIRRRLSGIYLKLAKWSFYLGKKKRCKKLVYKSLKTRINMLALATLCLLQCAPGLLSSLYARTRDF